MTVTLEKSRTHGITSGESRGETTPGDENAKCSLYAGLKNDAPNSRTGMT